MGGDAGSKTLPKMPSQATWKAGDTVEVKWALQANHGGGYQYRLCPASEPLTEECFFKTPLDFVGKQRYEWVNGETFEFDGVYVTEGTLPEGSMWARNPIPRNDYKQTGKGFEPSCVENKGCIPNKGGDSGCKCSGMWGPYDLQIVDKVVIPKDLPSGEYVLGWRWDCEESSQVWQ